MVVRVAKARVVGTAGATVVARGGAAFAVAAAFPAFAVLTGLGILAVEGGAANGFGIGYIIKDDGLSM